MSTLWSGSEWEHKDEPTPEPIQTPAEAIRMMPPPVADENFFLFVLKMPFILVYGLWHFVASTPEVTMNGLPLGTQNPTLHRP